MPRSASDSPAFASASAISCGVPSTMGVQILRSTQLHAAVITRASMPSGNTIVPLRVEAFSMIFLMAFMGNYGKLSG